MGLLTLYTGTLLPWLGGTFWLVFADARYHGNTRPNRLRQLGYGFFIGYAVLFIAIMTSHGLTGTVNWPSLMAFLILFALGGAISVRFNLKPGRTIPSPPTEAATPVVKVLLVLAIVLMAIHLVFITVEIFTQALYPWDAWLTWVYRAKAWYLSGDITDMVSPYEWVRANSASVYTIDARHYPLFSSVVPYWAAISLGRWSETLVNLPVLCAGLALGMALYGQCREHGLGMPVSLFACYMLYSIPLLDTHLALAGYADIWMAGFTGLGFVALMRGIAMRGDTTGPGLQSILGLLMIAFSIWIKNEGVVWFLAALALIVLVNFRPRVPVLIAAVLGVLGLVAHASGLSQFEIPMIGTFGYVDGRLFIPFIGDFRLEPHDVIPVYWSNFFEMGSWNLFWLAVTGSLLFGLKSLKLAHVYRARRTALSFILVFFVVQWFIFGLTDQGLWADTYTAINRLPIHFVPALLFAILMIVHAGMTHDTSASLATGGSDDVD